MAREESCRTKKSIPAIVAFVCLFLVSSLYAPAAQNVWTGIGRIVAVGDVHGDNAGAATGRKMTARRRVIVGPNCGGSAQICGSTGSRS